MTQVLSFKSRALYSGCRIFLGDVLEESGWIQIVSKVESQRPNRSLISYPHAHRMRRVIITTVAEGGTVRRGGCTTGQTPLGTWLVPAHQPLQHVVLRRENVTHIVKHCESEAFPDIGQRDLRKTQFQIVDEQRRPSYGKARIGITRPCLIQPESAVGVAAARKKLFG